MPLSCLVNSVFSPKNRGVTLEKLEVALHSRHNSGKDLKFVNDQTDPPAEGVSESGKLKSHLPTPAHRLISERKLYDFDTIRTLLSSALNALGEVVESLDIKNLETVQNGLTAS